MWDNHISVEVNFILYFVGMVTREALFAWYIKLRVFKVVMCSCTVRELCMLSNTHMKSLLGKFLLLTRYFRHTLNDYTIKYGMVLKQK